jgi:hypothetical protein
MARTGMQSTGVEALAVVDARAAISPRPRRGGRTSACARRRACRRRLACRGAQGYSYRSAIPGCCFMTAIQPQLKETAAEPGRRGRLGGLLLWVALYAAVIYLPFLGSARTLTSHEVMVTHAAQRMLIDGHWVVPHFASGLWLDKPRW